VAWLRDLGHTRRIFNWLAPDLRANFPSLRAESDPCLKSATARLGWVIGARRRLKALKCCRERARAITPELQVASVKRVYGCFQLAEVRGRL